LKDRDHIKELFKEKLGNLETPVDPSLWAGIQSALPSAAPVGLSLIAKLAIGISAASVVGSIFYFTVFNNRNEQPVKETKNDAKEVAVVKDIEDASSEDTGVDVTQRSIQGQEPTSFEQVMISSEEPNSTTFVLEPTEAIVDNSTTHTITPIVSTETDVQNEAEPSSNADLIENETASFEENVEVQESEKASGQEPEVKIALPNVFSPNGDGDNDYLFLKDADLRDFQLVVLNKQNQVVFQTNDPNFKWDGTNQTGNSLPAGNYFYILTAYDSQGSPVNLSNSLTIVR
jgi:gliding motility-associated-like protein